MPIIRVCRLWNLADEGIEKLGRSPKNVVRDLNQDSEGGTVSTAGPRHASLARWLVARVHAPCAGIAPSRSVLHSPLYPTPAADSQAVEVACIATLTHRRLVTGSSDGILRVMRAQVGSPVLFCIDVVASGGGPESVGPGRCEILAVAAVGLGHIAWGGVDGTVCVVPDAASRAGETWGKDWRVLRGHANAVACLLAAADGRLISAGDDGMLRVWNQAVLDRARAGAGTSERGGSAGPSPVQRQGSSAVTAVASLDNGTVVTASADSVVSRRHRVRARPALHCPVTQRFSPSYAIWRSTVLAVADSVVGSAHWGRDAQVCRPHAAGVRSGGASWGALRERELGQQHSGTNGNTHPRALRLSAAR